METTAAVPSAPSVIHELSSIVHQLDLKKLFAVSQPLEIELGAGDGSFLAQYAAKFPDRNFIATERLLGRLKKIERKARRSNLANVRAIRIESSYFLRYLLPPHSAAALHIYFPDPWPKRRHAGQRLINEVFPELASQALTPSGTVFVRTDNEAYYRQIVETFGKAAGFIPAETSKELSDVKTDFEKEFFKGGIPALYAAYRRT